MADPVKVGAVLPAVLPQKQTDTALPPAAEKAGMIEWMATPSASLMVPAIHPALKAICAEMGGMPKDATMKAPEGARSYRSIEAALARLKPLMDAANVYPSPKVLQREYRDRTTKSGAGQIHALLLVRFRWRSALDGSFVDVVTAGEALDTSDKATNKAMTAAWKYAIMQTFACQFEDEKDQDAGAPEAGHTTTAAKAHGKPSAPARTASGPPKPPAAPPATRYSEAAEAAGYAALQAAGYTDREIGYIFDDTVKGGKFAGKSFLAVPLRAAEESVEFWTSGADKPNEKLARKWQGVVIYKQAAKAVQEEEALAEAAEAATTEEQDNTSFPFGDKED